MKILFLASNPKSTSRLNLGQEVREIEEGLRRSKLSDRFQLVQRWEVRPRDLRRALLEEEPDIVHFSGHGKGEEGLVVLDKAGKPKPATGKALAGLFTQFPQIKCVLLNACYAEVQARAIVEHIDYVIGMKDTILDDAAIAFTTGFYDGLGYGRTIEDAFELGKNAILWELSSFSDTTRKMIPVDLATTESTASLPEDLKPILLKKGVNNQNIPIQPSQNVTFATKDNSVQKYRQRIEEYLADRTLTPIEKFQLATLAKQSGISESEANNILQAELQQIEQAKKDYQTVLRQTIEQGYYPFNSQIQQQLKKLQASLKLTDSEVADISQLILEEAEIQIRSKKFTFQVVTVDERGRESSSRIEEAELFAEDLGDGVTLEMVKIPGGSFLMGTDDAEIARLKKIYNTEWFSRERPQHQVNVTSFLMGRYPITQAQWRIVAGWEQVEKELDPDPSYFKEDYEGIDRCTRAVEQISWDDAVEFCARLSHYSGRRYRLPTEAEWEYACRGGTTTPFHFGETISTDLANYKGTDWQYKGKVYPGNYGGGSKGISREQTTPVGYYGKAANAFGLYDMHGNVWEWCEDDWHDRYNNAPKDGSVWLSELRIIKVLRGGSWSNHPHSCRSAYRYINSRVVRKSIIGFRVAYAAFETT